MKNYTKEEVLNAIEKTHGFINEVARELKCNWHTAHKVINQHEETRQALEEKSEIILDKAEGNIYNAVESGDISLSKWILQTKGKARGYTEKETATAESQEEVLKILQLITQQETKTEHEVFTLDGLDKHQIENLFNCCKLFLQITK